MSLISWIYQPVIAASTPTATQTIEGHQPIPQISTDQHRPREMAMTEPPSLTSITWRIHIQQETITYCHTWWFLMITFCTSISSRQNLSLKSYPLEQCSKPLWVVYYMGSRVALSTISLLEIVTIHEMVNPHNLLSCDHFIQSIGFTMWWYHNYGMA